MANNIKKAVNRISKMEKIFDELKTAVQSTNDLDQDALQTALNMLSDYLSSGDWLHDYELDEQKLLPSDLKRGILAQDGLYELLNEAAEILKLQE